MADAQLGTMPGKKPIRFIQEDVQIEVTAVLMQTQGNGEVKVRVVGAYLTDLLVWETDHTEHTEKLLVKKKKFNRNFSLVIFKTDFNKDSKFVITFVIFP